MHDTYLKDILDEFELKLMVAAKRIKSQEHPTLPLTIWNYTDLATYAGEWTNSERVCRGLITGPGNKIIARGPSKFFNYGEKHAKVYPLDTMVRVTTKEDGSLGIGWYYVDEDEEFWYGLATRGSFTSEQALHATALVKENPSLEGHYEIMCDSLEQYSELGVSYIGEIVFPENRIVLDYGSRDAVIPLGTVDNATGLTEWRPGNGDCEPYHPTDPVLTLAEAIALPIPDDAEGYVLDVLDADGKTIDHIKLKGARYKELHAAIFGLTEKRVWEQLLAGTVEQFVMSLPDEVQPWAEEVAERIESENGSLFDKTRELHKSYSFLEGRDSRKDYAKWVMTNHKEISAPLFAWLDNDPLKVQNWIWQQVKPAHVPFATIKEEAK